MDTTDVTVIGVGVMGTNHVHAVSDHPLFNLDSVVDLDESRCETIADRYGANRALTDYETALDRADAAVIATPKSVHGDQAHEALDRGVDVLLEKPIGKTLDEARGLADRAAKTDLVTGVSFVLRYDPAYAKARQAAIDGSLGPLVSVRGQRAVTIESNYHRVEHRDHPLFYMNIHDIDAMTWCVDEPVTEVVGNERRGRLDELDLPDATQALLTYADGTIGVLEGYTVFPEETPGGIDSALTVVGEAGTASVDTPGNALTVLSDGYDRPDTRHWPVVNDRMDGAVRRQIDRFAESIRGDEEMLATIEDGARAQIVAETIRQSIASGERKQVPN